MLYFIRHGEAEHNINEPHNFHLKNPRLTRRGINDTKSLRKHFNNDIKIWCSPTVRTLETARLLNDSDQINILDILGPRIFPHKVCTLHNCDHINFDFKKINTSIIKLLDDKHPNNLTDTEFLKTFTFFIKNYIDGDQDYLVITHDGVIATLLKYFKGINIKRDNNNDLILSNEIYQFELQDILVD